MTQPERVRGSLVPCGTVLETLIAENSVLFVAEILSEPHKHSKP